MARNLNRQRKLERKAKKSAKRQQRNRQPTPSTQLSPSAARGLDEADELLASGQLEQALEVLEELARRYPRRTEILIQLAEAQLQNNDAWSSQVTCARLTAIDPREPSYWLALAAAALGNGQLATAQRAFARLAADWPDHADAARAREMVEGLREFLEGECRRRGLDIETGFRVLQLHDEINLQLNRGKFDRVEEAAARLLAICPTFAPALNNRSEARFRSGRYAEAIADSRRVLEFDATNYHALGNLTRYLYLSGQFDEAQATATALKACAAEEGDAFLKMAEALAQLGDWSGVLAAVHAGQKVWKREEGETPWLAEHLAGVAHANLGDLKKARQHWRRAAARSDAPNWAEINLADSQQPVGQRHGPWAFPLDHWVPRGSIESLLEAADGRRRERDLSRIIQRHFEQYPQLELLADVLLERGDPHACETLIRLAPFLKRPAIFAALKRFALGQRGSDELRMQALLTLSQAEVIAGEVEIWRAGARQLVRLTAQEISGEPTAELSPELQELMFAAHQAISAGRGAEAEPLLDEFLRLRPGDVSARYNRAVALGLQGREAESLEIIRQLHREKPDYVFARTHLAGISIAEGDLEQAQSLLAPLSQKQRLHTSEYAAWCSVNIDLALAEGDHKRASSFLSSWEHVDPDNPGIKVWQGRLRAGRGLVTPLRGLLD